ncbi:hypothetical protein [Prosthecomicrobium pneumaticum]|uniref:Capsular biosynthesis protein n=1 Tax=Prosthecomicrobium pneumaticum TaxID=81895 RepID=A0A7W9FJS2_9HYPH|nr:hypothetical protein [Prosthecomicrobium pneumaticum]MBB5751886.1 hypothetical protein [Prosthecomicrobium pneumaticum]
MQIDSFIRHAEWLPFPRKDLIDQCAIDGVAYKRLTLDGHPRDFRERSLGCVKKSPAEDGVPVDDEVLEAIIYSLCNEIERLPHEVDFTDQAVRVAVMEWALYYEKIRKDIIRAISKFKPNRVIYIQGFLVEEVILRSLAEKYKFECCAWEMAILGGYSRMARGGPDAVFNPKLSIPHSVDKSTGADDIGEVTRWNKNQQHESGKGRFSFPNGRLRLLLICQVYTDASQIFGTTADINPISLVKGVLEISVRRGAFVFVKLHPKEIHGRSPIGPELNGLTYRRLVGAGFPWGKKEFHHFQIDRESLYDTGSAIRDCDVVITINSQTALEAAVAGKEVILLSSSYFSTLPCFWHADRVEDIAPMLDEIAGGDRRADVGLARQALRDHILKDCVINSSEEFLRRITS